MKKQYNSGQTGLAARPSVNMPIPPPRARLGRPGRTILIFAVAMLSFLLVAGPSALRAQIVTNTYAQNRFYTMPAGYANIGTNWDVLTNCDMLEDPQGDIKDAAWSMATSASFGYPNNNMCQFMVEDYSGNMVIQDLNTGGVSGAFMADIVLANSPNMGMLGYQALVVYVVAPNDTAVVGSAYLDIYDVMNIGTPSISLSLRSHTQLSKSCNGYPHIDMWSDTSNLSYGLPTMSDFAIVWADGAHGDLTGWFGSVNNPGSMPTQLPSATGQYTNIYKPDVACVTSMDRRTGKTVKQIELTYGNGVDTLFRRTANASNVIHTEMQEPPSGSSTWSVPVGPTTLASYRPFAPRIEAMSQDNGSGNTAKWQIAVTELNTLAPNVWGYNNLNLTGTSLSAYAYVPPFNTSPTGHFIYQAACVAAGVGPAVNTTNIGNNQYTAGYYPWGTYWNYSRDISRLSGNIISSAPYVINDSSQHVSYYWDVNQSLSLANCSNSGKDLFAVWADTFGIVYKHSTSNTGTVWRMIKPATAQSGSGVYPNPAGSWIRLTDNEALEGYNICDATGRVVRKGRSLAVGEAIRLDGLARGIYLLHAARSEGSESTYKFTIK